VRLQVRATRDGRIEVDKILSGSPTLADAADYRREAVASAAVFDRGQAGGRDLDGYV